MVSVTPPLRVVLVWRGEPLEERVFDEPQPITIGTGRTDTFTVPESHLGDGFPLFSPSGAGGYVLSLADGMGGRLTIGGDQFEVGDFLREGRGVPTGGARQQPLATSDW